MAHLKSLDTSIQKTNEWLHQIGDALKTEDRRSAYAALRGTLHALRDHLSVDEIAQLGAQLPLVVRGVYYEGWNPGSLPQHPRGKEEFLTRLHHELRGHNELWNTEHVARVTLAVIADRVGEGEITQLLHQLPSGIRELWPHP